MESKKVVSIKINNSQKIHTTNTGYTASEY